MLCHHIHIFDKRFHNCWAGLNKNVLVWFLFSWELKIARYQLWICQKHQCIIECFNIPPLHPAASIPMNNQAPGKEKCFYVSHELLFSFLVFLRLVNYFQQWNIWIALFLILEFSATPVAIHLFSSCDTPFLRYYLTICSLLIYFLPIYSWLKHWVFVVKTLV